MEPPQRTERKTLQLNIFMLISLEYQVVAGSQVPNHDFLTIRRMAQESPMCIYISGRLRNGIGEETK